jgi:hypothetical protein
MFRPRAVQRSASSNAITTTTTTTRTKILASADTDTDKAVSPTRNKTETGSKVERDSSTTVSDSILIVSPTPSIHTFYYYVKTYFHWLLLTAFSGKGAVATRETFASTGA